MSLAQKYRARFEAQRGDRLTLYFAMAVVLHIGAIALGFKASQFLPPLVSEPEPAIDPIEFVYLEPSSQPTPASTPQTQRRAAVDASAAGVEQPSQPVNAGKPDLPGSKMVAKPVPGPTATTEKSIQASPIKSGTMVPAKATRSEVPRVSPLPQIQPDQITKSTPAASTPSAATPTPLTSSSSALSAPTASPPEEQPAVETPPDTSTATAPSTTPSTAPSDASLPPLAPADATPFASSSPNREPEPIAPEPPAATGNQGTLGTGLTGMPNADQASRSETRVAATQDVVLGAYMNDLNRQIEQHWRQVPVNTLRQPIVWFMLNRQGELIDLGLSRPSGSEAADQAALTAVQTAAPFEALPVAYEADQLRINFTFTYDVMPTAQESSPAD